MNNLKLNTYNLILTLFQVGLVFYLLFLISNVLTDGFVAYYVNFIYWLWFLIILGIAILGLRKYFHD